MAQTTKEVVKQWFLRGLKPTEQQFHSFIDSVKWWSDKIPPSAIEGLNSLLIKKADKQAFETHINDSDKHVSTQEKENWSGMMPKFYKVGNTLKIHNIKTAFNPKGILGGRLIVFIKLPELKRGSVSGKLIVGCNSLVNQEQRISTAVTPNTIEFNTSIFDGAEFSSMAKIPTNLGKVSHSKLSVLGFSLGEFRSIILNRTVPEESFIGYETQYRGSLKPYDIFLGKAEIEKKSEPNEELEGLFISLPIEDSAQIPESAFAYLSELNIITSDGEAVSENLYKNNGVDVRIYASSEFSKNIQNYEMNSISPPVGGGEGGEGGEGGGIEGGNGVPIGTPPSH
ncbi:hypothetical protein PL373_16230 [Tenacibaculum maritimum]|nr:hypothetical protein [Tenacibaculum maritimum]MDB0602650.1 hypothetical protein [Tenacibaculum maritimum]MDB0611239.1 hypothetical protein [Tenacibaculum maritimum]